MEQDNNLSGHFQSFCQGIHSLRSKLQQMGHTVPNPPPNSQSLKRIDEIITWFQTKMVSSIPITAKSQINAKFQHLKEQLKQINAIPEDETILSRTQTEKKKSKKYLIQQWVGEMIRVAVEEAYKMYMSNGNEEQMKLDFATFILEQHRQFTLQLSKLEDISLLEDYFSQASGGAIQYLQLKFESTSGKAVDRRLGNTIKEFGKFIDPKYDILMRSKTDINIDQKKSTVSSIKHFINKVISECHSKSDMWKKFVEDIFNVPGDVPMSIEYGSKIKTRTSGYTEDELNSEEFFVTGNEIMRLLMKWIQELISIFTNPQRSMHKKEGFRIIHKQEIRMISSSQKQDLWKNLHARWSKLKKQMTSLNKKIQGKTSQLMFVSMNSIKDFQYLDQSVLSMLMISENIWELLENYMVNTLCIVFKEFFNLKKDYYGMVESGMQVFSFTLGDLLRCRATGTKDQIEQVWAKLQSYEQQKMIKILRVKNRLNQATSDFLINFAFENENQCFLICEMQIALKKEKSIESQNHNHAYHFMHFLYQMARSPHGVIIELAVKLYEIDNRKKFVSQHHLKFEVKKKEIELSCNKEQKTQRFFCLEKCSRKTKDKQTRSQNNSIRIQSSETYICYNCQKLIPSNKFCLYALSCTLCDNIICPSCYLSRMDLSQIQEIVLKDSSIIKRYFQPAKVITQNQHSGLDYYLDKEFGDGIFGVVYNKYFSGVIKIKILKRVEMKGEKYYLTAFDNKLFDIKENIKNSIAIIIKPRNEPVEISKDEIKEYFQRALEKKSYQEQTEFLKQYLLKYDCLDPTVIKKFKENQDGRFLKLTGSDQNSSRCAIICYDRQDSGLELQMNMAEQRMKQIVGKINKQHESSLKLTLSNVYSFDQLAQIVQKDNITDIEIEEIPTVQGVSEEHYFQLFSYLTNFKKVTILSIYKTPCYRITNQYSFDNQLQELIIKECGLESTDIQLNYPNLQKLDLSRNHLRQIPKMNLDKIEVINISNNRIESLERISTNLIHLRRVVAKWNDLKSLPAFDLCSLKHLNVSHNEISQFNTIKSFRTEKLKYLNLSINPKPDSMSKRNKQLPNLENLKELSQLIATGCRIDKIDNIGYKHLKLLRLNHNLLSSVPGLQNAKIDHLDLSNNLIQQQDIASILNKVSADNLQVFKNPFTLLQYNTAFKGTVIIEESKLGEKKEMLSSTNSTNTISSTSTSTLLLICHNCQKEIKEDVMLYDTMKNVKLCLQCDKIGQVERSVIKIKKLEICSRDY